MRIQCLSHTLHTNHAEFDETVRKIPSPEFSQSLFSFLIAQCRQANKHNSFFHNTCALVLQSWGYPHIAEILMPLVIYLAFDDKDIKKI